MGKWTPKAYTGGFNLPSIVHGAFITILALSGFEHLPKMAEETQNSSRNIPLAITSSLSIAAVMYALTSISTNSVLGTKTVAKTINPISKTYSKLIGGKGESLVNVVSLFSIFNTVMLTMLFVSRQIYGIAKRGTFSSYFTKVNKITQTPIRSILFVSLCTFLLTNIKEVELIMKLGGAPSESGRLIDGEFVGSRSLNMLEKRFKSTMQDMWQYRILDTKPVLEYEPGPISPMLSLGLQTKKVSIKSNTLAKILLGVPVSDYTNGFSRGNICCKGFLSLFSVGKYSGATYRRR